MDPVLPWLTLKSVPGLGNKYFLTLLEHFGSPQAVLEASAETLWQAGGIPMDLAAAIARYSAPGWVHAEIEKAKRRQFSIITLADANYPRLLRHIADPPPVLYIYGRIMHLEPTVAIVGSRKATNYGLRTAAKLAGELARKGWTIVSGMASGIDTAAHKAALANGARTIAVLGTGLNVIYPKQNKELFHAIAQSGAVISEFFLDTEPKAHHFPVRNRIISGLSYGTVIVEAARRSGALITARLALENGRDVFAVPGSIDSATSKGTHMLIRQGAGLVEDAGQISTELEPQLGFKLCRNEKNRQAASRATDAFELEPEEQKVLRHIGVYPAHIDEIANGLNLEPGRLAAILLRLELKGVIVQSPGKYFQRL